MMRTHTTKTTTWIGAAVLAAMCVACTERAEQKADDAASTVGNAVANGGRAADAAVETLDVKVALTADKRVDASDINVDSDHVTKTVTLKGRVPSADQKVLAGQIAAAKAVGYQVRNELVVGR